jgi:muconolactone D-isomerase
MEYLVIMTTHVPDGTPEQAVQDIRTREAAHSRELAAQGHLLRLWRPPLQPGEWRTLGLFAAADGDRLEEVLASARETAAPEEGTVTWYAFKLSDTTYGIFDTFASEDDRNAHLAGGIPRSSGRPAPRPGTSSTSPTSPARPTGTTSSHLSYSPAAFPGGA